MSVRVFRSVSLIVWILLTYSNFIQLIEECVKKENIYFDGGQPAEVFLGRDAMPSGESLLEAAKQVCFLSQ